MTLRSFLLGGALALTSANAMLVVPDVDADAVVVPDNVARLHPIQAQAAQQQQVDLACSECPFAIKSGDETALVSPIFLRSKLKRVLQINNPLSR